MSIFGMKPVYSPFWDNTVPNRTTDMDTATLQWRLATPVDEPLLIPMIRRFYAEDATPFDSYVLCLLCVPSWPILHPAKSCCG